MRKTIAIIFTMIGLFMVLPVALMAGNALDKAGNPTATPVVAFSLRLLSSSYTGKAINVRRSSDNTTQDIGFTAAGDLDTASLLSFVGGGNGYVSIWYDQSGNGINATQVTAADQPQIVSSGVIYRDNGRPVIYTSSAGYLTYGPMSYFSGSTQATRMTVARSRNGSTTTIIDGLGPYQMDCQILSTTSLGIQVNSGSIVVNGSTTNTNTLMAIAAIRNNGASQLYVNGTLAGSNTSTIGTFSSSLTGYIGVRNDMGAPGPGSFSESILFSAVVSSADLQAIDNNQNGYYSLVRRLDKAGNPTASPVTAYSLRLLSSGYTGMAINVRRSSDNTTQGIGFTASGDLDTASLKTFVGGGNGFVSIWYDQSGNGINATQTNTADQPQIVNSGVIYRDNGKPVMYTSSSGYLTYGPMSQFNGSYQASRATVARSRSGNSLSIIDGLGPYQLDCQMQSATALGIQVNTGSIVVNGTVANTNTLLAVNAVRNNAGSSLYVNGNLKGTNTSSIGTFGSSLTGYIGVRNDLAGPSPGTFSESILFNTVLSTADLHVIDSSQISYYSLVNPLDMAGSPGAKPVTAYSLRQLGSNYAGKAINVRRSSDNTTQDIGFTSAGDLDTASLKTFVGSGNGYVSIWYDQSGNGINATQGTTSTQPQIVNGGVIYRDNGKPVLYTSGSGYLSYGPMNQFSGSTQATRTAVGRSRNGNTVTIIDGLGPYQMDCQILSTTSLGIQVNTGSIIVNGSAANTNVPMAISAMRSNGASQVYVNGTLAGANTSGIGTFSSSLTGYIGVRNDLGAPGPGAFSETILFNSVLSGTDLHVIDSSQIGYYALVTPPNPLDKLGSPTARPVAAFSLRQLGSAYSGKAINVRRSSDNTTQDIGFTGTGDLDTAALRAFVGSGNGYVTTWYDQSGNGYNATQTNTADQPLIVTSGAINIDNGRPSIYTSTTGYLSYAGMTQFNGGYQATRMAVQRSRNGNTLAIIEGLGSYQMDCQMLSTNSMAIQVNGGSILVNGTVGNSNSLMAVSSTRNNGASNLYVNGALLGSNSSIVGAFGSTVTGMIGLRNDLGAGGPGAFSETILFSQVLSDSDRNMIDSNQMNYFSVTNAIDKVGTVASNPVAAFSLRQLSTGYSGKAIQVRRDSDNTLQDIGFTSTGDLDTASLKTFVGSGSGYVATWYDQSGQKRNKTQTTASLQPQIINAGVIYRAGAQPVIYLPSTSGVGLVGAAPDYLAAGDVSVVLTAWSNASTVAARRAIQGRTQNWLVGPDSNRSVWYGGGYIVNDSLNPWKATGEVYTVIEPANGANDMYRNGLKVLNVSNAYKTLPGSVCVSAAGAYNEPMNGYLSELLEFNTALSQSDRDTIERSSGNYNGITVQANNLMGAWLPAIQPAEVFSLRQVNTGYGGPLVRINVSDTYYDVYPDDDGNLSLNSYVSAPYTAYNADTTGVTYNLLSSVDTSSSVNATVAIWYDQSGRGWNALQATDANQPLLIQSGVLVMAPGNSRAALLFSQASQNFLQGDVHEVNGFNSVTVNAVCYQRTVNSQVLVGKDKVWNFMLGSGGVNGAGSFNSSQNGTVWSDSVTRFIALGLPSENKVVGMTGEYGNAGQAVFGNGIPLGSLNATLPALGSGSQPMQISGYGGAGGSNYWDGYIQEIVLTDSVLGSNDLRLLTASQQSYYNTRGFTSWTGSGSQSWSDACSWSGGLVPVAQQSLYIPAGMSTQPNISSSVTAPDSLIVAPGATVTIASGGSFTGGAPKVVLLASPSAAGYLINTPGVALGATTIQKWMVGQQGFRMLAYPFDSAQSGFLTGASAVNGLSLRLNSGTGSSAPSSSTPAIPDDSISDAQYFAANAWTNMVNGSANADMPYALYYKGLATAFDSLTGTYGPSPFAFTVSGATNTGTSVSIPAANSTTAFTVAGNPFTAPVTTLAMTGDASGNTSYYVWEIPVGTTAAARMTDAGQWVPYLPGNRLLPIMSAMAFQQATASSTISIPTTAMTTTGTLHTQLSAFGPVLQQQTSKSLSGASGSGTNIGTAASGNNPAQGSKNDGTPPEYLELDVQENGGYRDRLFIWYDDHATDQGTDRIDMGKLFNKGANIYTITGDNKRLAVDGRKVVTQPVPLGVTTAGAGAYRFVVKKNALWNSDQLYLRDNKLQTETSLKPGAVYEFTIGEGEAGSNETRFVIINKSVPDPVEAHTFSAVLLGSVIDSRNAIRVMIQNSDDVPVSVELFSMQGVRLATTFVQSGEVDLPTTAAGDGMYIIRCTKQGKTILLKTIIR